MTGPRDWDKELAEIDKLMAPQGAEPRPSGRGDLVAKPAATPTGRDDTPRRLTAAARRPLAVWLITLLGPVGAAGLAVWPYPKACGLPLGVYLVGLLAVWGASIWGMRTAWAAQRAAAMVIGVLTLIASLTLVALEVLPRVGYARTSLTWTCST
jgi:hypothetical protein